MKDELIIPSDVEQEEEGYGDEEDIEDGDGEDEQNEDEVFQLAKENEELGDLTEKKPEKFVNEHMLKKIEKLESKMIDKKGWQMQGEIQSKDRPVDSLL